jgi:hypothetical protein
MTKRVKAIDETMDTEGHRARPQATEPMGPEGHRARAAELDTEGHRARPQAAEPIGPEGHRARPRATETKDTEGQSFLVDPHSARQVSRDRSAELERAARDRARQKEARPNKQHQG